MTQIPSDHEELPNDLREFLQLAGKQNNGVPKGLTRCQVCGDWIGRCLWQDPLMWHLGRTRVTCRCEANLCTKCGEPIYDYKLGSNVYSEEGGEVSHAPGMVGAFHRCGGPRIQLPCPIEPDWDQTYAPLLAGFPVQLVYVGVRARNDESRKPIVVKAHYNFDPGSYFENARKRQMRYRSRLPSDFYVDVLRRKPTERWETYKFRGSELLSHAAGESFEEVMRGALAIGLQADEPAC